MDRIGYIGGSDAYAACGLSSWKPQLTLYLEKIGRVIPTDISQQENIDSGVLAEPIIAHKFSVISKLMVRKNEDLLMSEYYPFMGAHVDYYVTLPDGRETFLECKNVGYRQIKEWIGANDNIPEYVRFQVNHYMTVLKLDWCYVGAWIGGQKFIFKKIQRSQIICDFIIEKEAEFWDMVQTRKAPELMIAVEEDPSLTKKLYPAAYGSADIDLSSIEDKVTELYDLGQEIKAKMDRMKQLKACIGSRLETAPKGHTNSGFKVSYGSHDSDYFNEKLFKRELPHVYAKYVTKGKVRPLRVMKPDESESIEAFDLMNDYSQVDAFTSDFN